MAFANGKIDEDIFMVTAGAGLKMNERILAPVNWKLFKLKAIPQTKLPFIRRREFSCIILFLQNSLI